MQTPQKVMIVNGNSQVLELLETTLDAGHYDVVFVESMAHAYSQIKRVQPNLVILCVRLDEVDGFHVLSMLKLDEETRDIPVLTFTSDGDQADEDEAAGEGAEEEIFTPPPAAMRMN